VQQQQPCKHANAHNRVGFLPVSAEGRYNVNMDNMTAVCTAVKGSIYSIHLAAVTPVDQDALSAAAAHTRIWQATGCMLVL
jgi:hypothetical protein